MAVCEAGRQINARARTYMNIKRTGKYNRKIVIMFAFSIKVFGTYKVMNIYKLVMNFLITGEEKIYMIGTVK